MPGCAVAKCGNFNRKTKGTNIRYFRFPKNSELSKQWIVACQRYDKINLKNACICSIHFEDTCFEISLKHRLLNFTPKNYRILKANAVPTLHLPLSSQAKKAEKRSLRMAKRRKLDIDGTLEASCSAEQMEIAFPANSNIEMDNQQQV